MKLFSFTNMDPNLKWINHFSLLPARANWPGNFDDGSNMMDKNCWHSAVIIKYM